MPHRDAAQRKAYNKAYYQRNRERALARTKELGPVWVAANPDKVAAIKARWRKRHPDYIPKYRAKYPEREAANYAVTYAIQCGSLVPLPCWVCGATKTEAHHADYSRPLDVVWLCHRHHQQLHKEAA